MTYLFANIYQGDKSGDARSTNIRRETHTKLQAQNLMGRDQLTDLHVLTDSVHHEGVWRIDVQPHSFFSSKPDGDAFIRPTLPPLYP
jgi:hypothetical protein